MKGNACLLTYIQNCYETQYNDDFKNKYKAVIKFTQQHDV